VNRRRAHLFLSGLDYYKTNPPGNVKGSEDNRYFDMTCGGLVKKPVWCKQTTILLRILNKICKNANNIVANRTEREYDNTVTLFRVRKEQAYVSSIYSRKLFIY